MIIKHKFQINGLHCASCKILLETEIGNLPGVKKINVDANTGQTELEYDDSQINLDKIYNLTKKLNYSLAKLGVVIPAEKKFNQFWLGILLPVVLGMFVLGYVLISRLGGFQILAQLNQGQVGYGLIFIIGLLAGFHCIGMCGSIVVTYSTICFDLANKNEKKSVWPHLQYNFGRIISYTLIGGILGGFGSFFGVNPIFNGVLIILAGLFILVLGISFVTKSSILEKIKLRTPKFIAKYIFEQKNKKQVPFIIGLLNGFMPCGPLQAMQLYALASGSFGRGALSLLIYGLGTVPLMFGFGAFLSFISQKQIKNILKFSGILVIILSLLMINRGLANFGVNLSALTQAPNNSQNSVTNTSGSQEVKMDLTYSGYQPNVLNVKVGIPVRWVINVKQMSGCSSSIKMDDYGIYKQLSYGENIIEFTPTKAGEIKFSCGMGMIWGKFIVN